MMSYCNIFLEWYLTSWVTFKFSTQAKFLKSEAWLCSNKLFRCQLYPDVNILVILPKNMLTEIPRSQLLFTMIKTETFLQSPQERYRYQTQPYCGWCWNTSRGLFVILRFIWFILIIRSLAFLWINLCNISSKDFSRRCLLIPIAILCFKSWSLCLLGQSFSGDIPR